jgi:hypothetical protein
MIFCPHVLQILVISGAQIVDGNPIPGSESRETIGKCRCDDNGQHKQVSVNGILYDYSYHVVHEGAKLPIGVKVRALDKDGNVRGEGEVVKSGKCNYFNYSEVWI